jgi:hypothetical protein
VTLARSPRRSPRPLALAVLLCHGGLLADAAPAQELLVSGYLSDAVHRYDYASGASLGSLGGVNGAHAVSHGVDGLLYVAAEEDDKILRFDPATLLLVDEFVADDPTTPQDETGGLDGPTCAIFGADGNLYVASFNTDAVLRYDGADGSFIDVFVTAGQAGLNGPDAGMAFGPDGHLYVPSYFNHRVVRYDGADGASLGDFVAPGAGGLLNPRTLRFRSDGVLYVSGEGSGSILRFDRNGAFLDAFITVAAPTGFVLSPFDGDVYVADIQRDAVSVFDGGTGARLRTLVRPGAGGLSGAVSLTFLEEPWLVTGRIDPGNAGQANTLTIRNGTPNAAHYVIFGSVLGSLPIGRCPHQYLGIADPLLVPIVADAAGRIVMSDTIDPAASGLEVLIQTFDPTGCQLSNLVEQVLK